MCRRRKWTIVAGVLLTVVGIGYGYWRYKFPYGYSHCCDLGLYQALEGYAANHGGAFPAGEATPEASLSLLYPAVPASLLAGRTVSESLAQEILDRGERLGPDS